MKQVTYLINIARVNIVDEEGINPYPLKNIGVLEQVWILSLLNLYPLRVDSGNCPALF